jgi:hypothetical protein
MTASQTTGSPPQCGPTAAHGVVRGHAITAINMLRTRIAEPWTWEPIDGL